MFNFINIAYAEDVLVKCATIEHPEPCTINNLFDSLNLFSAYLLYTIFPFAFFFALIYAFIPVIKDPSNPGNINHLKHSLGMIAIGTLFVVGSFFLVRALFDSLGVSSPVLNDSFKQPSESMLFIDRAYAQDVIANQVTPSLNIKNPLEVESVKAILDILLNILFFIVVIAVVYGYVRGALLLVLSQQSPENIKKGKQWIIWTTVIAVVIFSSPKILGIIMDTVDSLKPRTGTVEVGCIDSSVIGGCAAAGLKSSE
jgi:hypothetical protein